MVEPGFRKILTDAPAVAALVADRVFNNVRLQDERRPTIVMTNLSGKANRTFSGTRGPSRGRMLVDCLAGTYEAAKLLAVAAGAALEGFKGAADDTTFHWIEADDGGDVPRAPLTGQASPLFGVRLDVTFMYSN